MNPVFPTHVGMNRVYKPPLHRALRVPHARGDEPRIDVPIVSARLVADTTGVHRPGAGASEQYFLVLWGVAVVEFVALFGGMVAPAPGR